MSLLYLLFVQNVNWLTPSDPKKTHNQARFLYPFAEKVLFLGLLKNAPALR
jgi:hypothetical protein